MAQSSGTALSELVAAELPYLRRYARALTGRQQAGDAYAATTLEAILADRAVFDPSLPPRVALFKVFHSVWSSSGRQVTEADDPADPLEAKAQQRLAELTPNTREALLLNTIEGFAPDKIATIMSVAREEAVAYLDIAVEELAKQVRGRVLIIEDEPIIAMDIQSIVTGNGHVVTGIARTREDAVARVEAEMPDLVLADVQLADGSSGIDAANDILRLKPEMPVVFITAYPERLLTGARPEPAFLITKPFQEEQIRVAVSQSLFFATTEALA
ncbi:MAG: response regulator [Pseudomonadota bacterium]